MVMRSMRGEGKSGGVMKYFLFTLLGMAVGGLVLGSFADTNSSSSNDVAKINGKPISIQAFDRSLQRSISRYSISTKQAYKMGLADEVLAGEIRSYLLLNEAENLGIEISKDRIAARIAEVVKPYTQDGQTLQAALELLLRRQGMSEKDFVHEIKKEISGEILMNAIRRGFSPAHDLLAHDLYMFQTQTRDVDIVLFPDNDIKIGPATDEQLAKLYEATKATKYRVPEYRSAYVASFDPASMDIEFSVSDEELMEAYENHKESFRVGEQLVLSQIVTKDEQQAKDIYELTEGGTSLKAAVIKVMGKDAAYIEGISFETSMMLPDLMKALEAREIGKISPPVKTMIGYHVVKLDNILEPSIRPFNEVKAGIKKELLEIKKSDYFYNIATDFDKMLNDEMSLGEISSEMDIKITSIDFIDNMGLNKQGNDGLEIFDAIDKKDITTTIFEIEGEMPSSMQDFGGKLVSFALKSKEEATFKPLEIVKAELLEQFNADMRRSENELLMQKYLAEISTGGSTLESIAADNNTKIKTISDISIAADPPNPLTPQIVPLIFKTTFGAHEVIRLDGQSALIKISGYGYSGQDDLELKNKEIENIKTRISEEGKDEAFLMYLHSLSNKYPTTVNQRLLERAYGDN